MGKRRIFFDQILEQSALGAEGIPGQPIVEISGEHRVLIENHQGVAAYGQNQILVNVKFGSLCICGCGLEMMHMTKEQLIVTGRIDSVGLLRRKSY